MQSLNKHAEVVLLSLVPFVLSAVVAIAIWDSSKEITDTDILTALRLSFAAVGWVVTFAAGTRLFWKVVLRLAPR